MPLVIPGSVSLPRCRPCPPDPGREPVLVQVLHGQHPARASLHGPARYRCPCACRFHRLGAAVPEPQVAADLRPVILERTPSTQVGCGHADLAGDEERHRLVIQLRPAPRELASTGVELQQQREPRPGRPALPVTSSRSSSSRVQCAANWSRPTSTHDASPRSAADESGGTVPEWPAAVLPGTRHVYRWGWLPAVRYGPGNREVPIPDAEAALRLTPPFYRRLAVWSDLPGRVSAPPCLRWDFLAFHQEGAGGQL